MSDRSRPSERPRALYRLEVDGELGDDWAAWFEVERLRVVDGRTVLDVAVADQAQLHALLRRIHDLHLTLLSLTRASNDARSIRG